MLWSEKTIVRERKKAYFSNPEQIGRWSFAIVLEIRFAISARYWLVNEPSGQHIRLRRIRAGEPSPLTPYQYK